MLSPSSSSSSLFPRVDFQEFLKSKEIQKTTLEEFKDAGVLVLEEVFSAEECKNYCSSIISCMCKISPDLKVSSISLTRQHISQIKVNWNSSINNVNYNITPFLLSPAQVDLQTGQPDFNTWKPKNLPPGPRSGLFQALVSTFPPVLEIREDPRILEIFEMVYSNLRGRAIKGREKYFSSMDGINVRPYMAPFHKEDNDWAHLDQTIPNQPFLCVQGQVVCSEILFPCPSFC